MRYSSDRQINDICKELVRSGWSLCASKRHTKLTKGGITLCVPNSPSDYRARLNFRADARRAMARLGESLSILQSQSLS